MTPFKFSIESLKQLITFDSVSAKSNRAISDWVSNRLETLGFTIEQTSYLDHAGIEKTNVLAKRDPVKALTDNPKRVNDHAGDRKGLAYFCHTDVVPTRGWNGPGDDPFCSQLLDDRIYGRGSCDMKGSLAAMMAAASEVDHNQQRQPLWIICTADEEVGFLGAKHLVQESNGYQEIISQQPLGLIGEPTNLNVVHAHKGIVGFKITSIGKAAHSSTNHGINANRQMVPLLQKLLEINERTESETQYQDDRFDPPTLSWNFGCNDGCTAINITPDRSTAWLSLRPMPEIDGADLIAEVRSVASELGLEMENCGQGPPMWISPTADGIRELSELTGNTPKTVCYGTDGGELHALKERVVYGPGDIAQAHTTDEWIALEQLDKGSQSFCEIVRGWCC